MKLDGKSIQIAIAHLVEEYKLDPYQVLDVIRTGIKSGFKRDFPEFRKSEILVNIENDGTVTIYKSLLVVEEIEAEEVQILLADARKIREDIELGEQMLINITPERLELSRIAAQVAAQTIKQGIKNIEREKFYDKFQDKEGALLKAKVLRVHEDSLILDIEWTNVSLGSESQIPNRVYEQGDELFVYLKKISKDSGGIFLDITQTSSEYVSAMLQQIVPELDEGIVIIDKIARIAGKKTKILVSSTQEDVDPVGVMVGHKGDRVKTLDALLEWEKVDFIHNTSDQTELLTRLFAPAKVESISFPVEGEAVVRVNEEQKPLAIGKWAVNIKLISQISGLKVKVI